MKKLLYLLLILLQSVLHSQSNDISKASNHISFGLFDYKTGFTFINYSKTFLSNSDHEYFAAIGTSIAANTISMGLKKYIFNSDLDNKFYAAFSLHGTYGLGKLDDFIAPSIAFGLDVPLRKDSSQEKNWILDPIKQVNNYITDALGKTYTSPQRKESLNTGISSFIRINGETPRFVIMPYINLSYHW